MWLAVQVLLEESGLTRDPVGFRMMVSEVEEVQLHFVSKRLDRSLFITNLQITTCHKISKGPLLVRVEMRSERKVYYL